MRHDVKPFDRDGVGKPCCYCKRIMLSTSYNEDPDPAIRGQTCSIEHLTPRSKNGSNESYNLKLACSRCNSLRGNLEFEIFDLFARVIIRQYPDVPLVYLRSALNQFVISLAEIAIRNKRESKRALSLSLLKLGDDLKHSR